MQKTKSFLLFAIVLMFFCTAFSQSFKIGTLDIYGNRKTDTNTVLQHLKFKIGDSINHDNFKPEEIAAQLEKIPGVKHATANAICCDTNNNIMLYIGIGESDSVILKYRNAPVQNIKLPDTMTKTYQNLIIQNEKAVESGQSSEDDSQGYSLVNFEPAKNEQLKFILFAKNNFALLSDVLKNSKFAEQRAAAAEIIAYSSDRKKVLDNLIHATHDADEEVRNNSIRALGVLAGYLNAHPELKITVPAEPFIRLLNSIVWTDRNKGAMLLMQLTQKRDAALLQKIKQQALPSIIEMANWADRNHALMSFIILGRIAGADEQELFNKNNSGEWKDYVIKLKKTVAAK
ncbi:MAG TPA: FtsQ-type POTRA domain-containing protein [Puia sp.]|nr:FtsQ-type POTRA domain-containing protein [Puia sp.]